MCFPRIQVSETDLVPKFDTDGNINDSENSANIPEAIEEHSDTPFLDRFLLDGIVGFVYENSYELVIVWLNENTQQLAQAWGMEIFKDNSRYRY